MACFKLGDNSKRVQRDRSEVPFSLFPRLVVQLLKVNTCCVIDAAVVKSVISWEMVVVFKPSAK